MSDRSSVTTADLQGTASLCANSVRRLDPELWDKLAYGLEWTRSFTVTHICDALAFYAASLAARLQDDPGSLGLQHTDGSIDSAADQIEWGAAILSRGAESTPIDLRAFYPSGTPDAEGFLAMGCVEILLHGYDVVVSTEAEFDPEVDLCRRILGRLFPWAPQDSSGWPTLLWATGRAELGGQEYMGDRWFWHTDLVEEWEGTIPTSDLFVGQ